jgi:hypothetical protein
MKKLLELVVSVLAISLLIGSCSKDTVDTNTNEQIKNSITYDGKIYYLNGGFLEYYGIIQGTGYNIDLILITSGLTPVITNGQVDSITGTGSGINFELFSSNSTALEVGDYTFDASSSGSPGTFDFGNAIFNFNTTTGTGATQDINGGKVTIKSNGSIYELSFNCTAADGKSVTGYYKGSLNYYAMAGTLRSGKINKRYNWLPKFKGITWMVPLK